MSAIQVLARSTREKEVMIRFIRGYIYQFITVSLYEVMLITLVKSCSMDLGSSSLVLAICCYNFNQYCRLELFLRLEIFAKIPGILDEKSLQLKNLGENSSGR